MSKKQFRFFFLIQYGSGSWASSVVASDEAEAMRAAFAAAKRESIPSGSFKIVSWEEAQ